MHLVKIAGKGCAKRDICFYKKKLCNWIWHPELSSASFDIIVQTTYVMHSHKTGTSDILDKMGFWYHRKEHTFSFNVIPKSSSYSSYLLRCDNLCLRPLAVSLEVWLWEIGLKIFLFLFPIFWNVTGSRKCRIFVRKCLKISQKLHRQVIEVILRYVRCVKKQKSQNQTDRVTYFSPLCQLQLSYISK